MGSTDMAATSARHQETFDLTEQYKHVESLYAIANSIEGRSGGVEDVVGKMKKKEMFWGRDLFIYCYC